MPVLARVHTTRSSKRKLQTVQPALENYHEPVKALGHDALNLITALELYCDLLAEPGVLAPGKEYFASDLRTVVNASAGLIGRLAGHAVADTSLIHDLASAVRNLYGPLKAVAGTAIDFEMECLLCPGNIRLSEESLARILVSLTRNAAEAMPQGGRIRITLQQGGGGSFFDGPRSMASAPRTALLCVQDSGPGISAEWMERIFEEGFSTKGRNAAYRGLGLSTTRRLVEEAGGSIRAVSLPGRGARFEVELPLVPALEEYATFSAEFPERTTLEC